MKELPKYRIIKPYRWYSKGFIIQPPAMLRNELLRGGFIELVIEPPVIPAEASTDIEPEQPPAQVEPPTQKRGRRKRVNNQGDSAE